MENLERQPNSYLNSRAVSARPSSYKPASLKPHCRLLLVDDHLIFLRGLRLILETATTAIHEFEVIAEAHDGTEAITLANELLPDVVLLDINLPGGKSGFDICRLLRLQLPRTAIIILSVYEDDEQLFAAIRAGAAGYGSKGGSPENLVELVEQVANGGYPINAGVLMKAGVAKRVLNQFQDLSSRSQSHEEAEAWEKAEVFAALTAREMEILGCIAKGQSNKEIALTLFISDQTVKNHITNILRKLNANDRTQAVMLALRQGWIKLSAK